MPTKNDKISKLWIALEDGDELQEVYFIDELPASEEELPFRSLSNSFDTLSFEAQLTVEGMDVIRKLFWPFLNNNWRKMHGLPMVRRKRYRHKKERKKKNVRVLRQ